MIKFIIFDWGNTLMRDFTQFDGPMATWPEIEVLYNVDAVLQKIYGKYSLCVASNAGESDTLMMRKALERADLDKYFNFFYTSKDLGHSKPDPLFYEEILCQSGFSAKESLMIGNDYAKDIVGAKQVGMHSILFNEEANLGEFPEADYVINGFIELPAILEILNSK